MSAFDHYMYVLSCWDGSLYTGYATDVRARLAAHRAGRGAKYTKAHAPVELVAQARFYSKQRAMSAEALFKQLPRERKDRLLRLAQDEPLETVLRRELPGFGEDSVGEFVARKLSAAVDEEYRAFMARLLPTVDRRRIVGVRTPELRAIAKELSRRDDKMGFMRRCRIGCSRKTRFTRLRWGLRKIIERPRGCTIGSCRTWTTGQRATSCPLRCLRSGRGRRSS